MMLSAKAEAIEGDIVERVEKMTRCVSRWKLDIVGAAWKGGAWSAE